VDLDSRGAVWKKGCVYVVSADGDLALPKGTSAAANAKSSTGRLDLLTTDIQPTVAKEFRAPIAAGLYTARCTPNFAPALVFSLVRPGMR